LFKQNTQKRSLSAMCDYSLHAIATRRAQIGDKLVTTQFPHTFTRGFSDVGDPNVAVCLLPGTELAFAGEVHRQVTLWERLEALLFKTQKGKVRHTVGRFRQIDMDNPATHHDAVEFPDGETVLVTRLRAGQHATVLQLPVGTKLRPEIAMPERRSSRADA
jgi:hypothetical protein